MKPSILAHEKENEGEGKAATKRKTPWEEWSKRKRQGYFVFEFILYGTSY